MAQGRFQRPSRTEFGREVGGDEIHWWIFKKEPDVAALRQQTEHVLQPAQELKTDSAALRPGQTSWADLVATLVRFTEQHAEAIHELLEYARSLAAKDILAPSILFNYKVWGSTRKSDRWPEIDSSREVAIQFLVPFVVGLRSRHIHAIDRAHFEIGESEYQRLIDQERDDPIEVSPEETVERASYTIISEFATYFEFVRNALRDVLRELDDFIEQRAVIDDELFWRQLIITTARARTEGQLYDFKSILPMWKAPTRETKEKGQVTFAEDVAAFANARGGVLIVGVTDQPRHIVGVGDKNVETLLKVASDTLANRLEYRRKGDLTTFRSIRIRNAEGEDVVCLVVIISQSEDVVGVHVGGGRYSYPIRRETGLERVSESSIAAEKTCLLSDNRDFLHDLLRVAGR
jgi:hypothetical protein